MYKFCLCALALTLALGPAGSGAQRTTRSTKRTTAGAKATSAGKKPVATSKNRTTSKGKATASNPRRTHGRPAARRSSSGQQKPTPDRYREIQQALADRGYLKSEPSGVWGQDSTEALKRFQEDQNLKPTGKLDSLSLITLGLGPKRTASSTGRPAEQPKTEQP